MPTSMPVMSSWRIQEIIKIEPKEFYWRADSEKYHLQANNENYQSTHLVVLKNYQINIMHLKHMPSVFRSAEMPRTPIHLQVFIAASMLQ
jgi:hypothetical protein